MSRTVVHVSDSSLLGGTERVIQQLLEGLDSGRWTNVLLHRRSPGGSALVAAADTLGVAHYGFHSPSSGIRGLIGLPTLVRQLRAIGPAVVHAHLHTPLACRFVILASMLARVPAIIATAHLYMEVASGLSTTAQQLALRSAVDRYIAVSAHVAGKLQDSLNVRADKIRLVRNAVRPETFTRPRDMALRATLTGGTNSTIVLAVARLAEQKGHRFLLKAIPNVPDAMFVFAGDGPERSRLETQAQSLGIAHRVRFLGHRTDVPDLLACADAVVLPSLYEGLPLTVLEAMAAGKPVVATSVGGTDEAVVDGETGLLVPPSDSEALATALQTVLRNDDLANRFGTSGRIRVTRHFRIDTMVEQVAAVYDEVLSLAFSDAARDVRA